MGSQESDTTLATEHTHIPPPLLYAATENFLILFLKIFTYLFICLFLTTLGRVETCTDSGANQGSEGKNQNVQNPSFLPSSSHHTSEKETPGRTGVSDDCHSKLTNSGHLLCLRPGLHQVFCSLLRLLQQPEDHRVAGVQVAHGLLHGGGQCVRLQPDDRH